MKKTIQPPPQLVRPKFPQRDFWMHEELETKDLEAYLTQTLPTLQFQKGSIQEAYQFLCTHLDIKPHPLIHIKLKQVVTPHNVPQAHFLGESIDSIRNKEEVIQFLAFQNTLVDPLTITLLAHLWPYFPLLSVLKLYNTTLTQREAELWGRIISENKLIKLFAEYVNILPPINQSHLIQLYLRGNEINSETLNEVLLANNKQFPALQVLELSDNPIGKEGVLVLAQFMSKKNAIQYLGLSRIDVHTWDELKPLLQSVGPERLSEQKLQAYRELEEKREKQIKEQLKQKKKEVVTDIELEPLIQNSDGSYSIQRNQQLQILLLSMNPFKDSDKDGIERFMTGNPQIQLVLQGTQMDTKVKDKIKKKFNNVIF